MPLPQSQGAWKGILSRRRGFITLERFCRRRGRRFVKALHQKAF